MNVIRTGLIVSAIALISACSSSSSSAWKPPSNLDDVIAMENMGTDMPNVGSASFIGMAEGTFEDGTGDFTSRLSLTADFAEASVTGLMDRFRQGRDRIAGSIELSDGEIIGDQFSSLTGTGTLTHRGESAQVTATLGGTFVGASGEERTVDGVRGDFSFTATFTDGVDTGSGTFLAIREDLAE